MCTRGYIPVCDERLNISFKVKFYQSKKNDI